MSLVGTRPPTVDEWEKYEMHHRSRLAFKPGLTGMWQVSGRSNITDLQCKQIKKAFYEVFMDVTDYLHTYRLTPEELAGKIMREIYEQTGITATAGIGTNLYLAKIAMQSGRPKD